MTKSLEKQTKKDVVDLLKLNNIKHWKNAVLHGWFHGFKSRNKYIVQTGVKGLSDYSCLVPDGSGVTLYIELKKNKGGIQSEDQKDFEKECINNNVPYILVSHWNDLWEFFKDVFGVELIRIDGGKNG